MKIFIIALDNTVDTLLPKFTELRHSFKVVTHLTYPGIWRPTTDARNKVLEDIEEYNPDIVINCLPALEIPTSSQYTYLGNTVASARLETHKWETRNKAVELGWKAPAVLEECDLDEVSAYDEDVYVKPKGLDPFHQSWKIPAGTDMATHNANFPSDIPAYVEESLTYEVGAYCEFVISNGSYSIRDIAGGTSNGQTKLWDSTADWPSVFTTQTLTDAQESAFRAKCETWLAYAATLGGNYEGSLDGAITSNGDVYWFEQNSRPSLNSIFAGNAQDWIDGLKKDCTKATGLTLSYG